MLTPRRLTAATAVLGGLALAALVVLTSTGVLPLGSAAATGAFLIMMAALAFAVLTVRRIDGRTHRIDLRVKRVENDLARTATAFQRIETRIDRLTESVTASTGGRADDLAAILASLGEDRVNAMARAREVEELGAEIRALRRREAEETV